LLVNNPETPAGIDASLSVTDVQGILVAMTGTPEPADEVQPGRRPPAPGALRVVQLFVNTNDLEDGIDELADADALRGWLEAHGLLEPGRRVTEADVEQAIAVREALRNLLLANNGGPVDPVALETLNRAAGSAQLVVRFDESGRPRLAASAPDVEGAMARILAIVNDAQVEDTWPRLKVCPEDTCRWAFYDHSRNRSSTWCSMAVCGNRAKARAYRRRHGAEKRGEKRQRRSPQGGPSRGRPS
jgi:predicted RNA-binding Zn ribbon-like protein